MRNLLKYLNPARRRIGLGISIKVVGTLVELLLPAILSHVLKVVVTRQSLRDILLWGGIMILCATLAVIFNITANRMAARVSRDFSEAVRHDLFDRTLHLSAAQTDRFTIPSLESRITTDTYNIHNFVGMMLRMGIRAPILLIGGVFITLMMDAHLALVMIAVLPFLFVLVTIVRRKGTPLYSNVQKSVDGMVRVVREDAQGIRVIKALSKADYEHRRYDAVNKKLAANERKAGITMGMVHPIMTVLMNGGIVAVAEIHRGNKLVTAEICTRGTHTEVFACKIYRIRAVQHSHFQFFIISCGRQKLRFFIIAHIRNPDKAFPLQRFSQR